MFNLLDFARFRCGRGVELSEAKQSTNASPEHDSKMQKATITTIKVNKFFLACTSYIKSFNLDP